MSLREDGRERHCTEMELIRFNRMQEIKSPRQISRDGGWTARETAQLMVEGEKTG